MNLHTLWAIAVAGTTGCSASAAPPLLQAESFHRYVAQFNKDDEELQQNVYPNATVWDFLKDNIPLLECPDEELQRPYYFRWWTYRKHIKKTPPPPIPAASPGPWRRSLRSVGLRSIPHGDWNSSTRVDNENIKSHSSSRLPRGR